jgi:cell shape-determining protein MreC
MTKQGALQANAIYIHSIEMLIHQVAEYEQQRENCVMMPREFYNEMIEDFRAMQKEIEQLKSENAALKSQLQLHNRPDVITRPDHDKALYGILQEMEGIKHDAV